MKIFLYYSIWSYLIIFYRYISNPTETLAELKAKGQSIPKAHGRIVAGDPAELIMISMAGKYSPIL